METLNIIRKKQPILGSVNIANNDSSIGNFSYIIKAISNLNFGFSVAQHFFYQIKKSVVYILEPAFAFEGDIIFDLQ